MKNLSPLQIERLKYQPKLPESLSSGINSLEVLEGSAAEKAGLQSGDMFIAMNDIIIESYEDLSNALSAQAVGDTVIFQIKRNGRMIQVEATLQENTNPKQ